MDNKVEKIETVENPDDDLDSRISMSKVYIAIGWIIILVAFILGIVLGNINTVSKFEYNSSLRIDINTKVFNTALMFYTWIGGFILSMFIMGIGSICHRLDLLIDKEK